MPMRPHNNSSEIIFRLFQAFFLFHVCSYCYSTSLVVNDRILLQTVGTKNGVSGKKCIFSIEFLSLVKEEKACKGTRMKTLPPFLNGTIDWLYNGAELHPLTEEHVKFITENLDVHYLLREEFSNRIKSEIFDHFDILKHKFEILVTVAQNLCTGQKIS
jgi:hypothetical protein